MLFLDDLILAENVDDYFVPVSEIQNAIIVSTSFNIDDVGKNWGTEEE